MEHFWSQPLSFLCTRILESNQVCLLCQPFEENKKLLYLAVKIDSFLLQTSVEGSLDSVKGILLQYASELPSVKRCKLSQIQTALFDQRMTSNYEFCLY